jgi:hypothetical protein
LLREALMISALTSAAAAENMITQDKIVLSAK